MMFQQPRRKVITEFRVIGCLCLAFTIGFLLSLNSFKDSHISTDASIPVDAIIIPGGGSQRGETPESLPTYVVARLNAALEYYQHQRLHGHSGTLVFIVLSQGTTHRPNYVNKLGWPVTESTSEALYLLHEAKRRGIAVRPQDILRENLSLDTIGNAFFTRVIHCDVAGFRRLHVITSRFHLARTKAIFEFIFGCVPTFKPYILSFQGTLDQVVGDVLAARVEREKTSLASFHHMITSKFNTELAPRPEVDDPGVTFAPRNNVKLRDVHQFMFTEHKAYLTREGMVPMPPQTEVVAVAGDGSQPAGAVDAQASGNETQKVGVSPVPAAVVESENPALLGTY